MSVILVGDNPASQSYVKSKANACASIGMENRTICMPGSTTQQELLEEVQRQNEDPEVDGILVQLPLPSHLDEVSVIDAISPDKDVDGLHPVNAGKLLTGRDGFVPCTPLGVMEMLTSIGYADLSGLNAVVIGRSNLVGKTTILTVAETKCDSHNGAFANSTFKRDLSTGGYLDCGDWKTKEDHG